MNLPSSVIRPKSFSGFTIIELLVASVIAISLMLTIVHLLTLSFRNAQLTNATQAINYGGQQTVNFLKTVLQKSGYEGCKPPSSLTLATGGINATASSITPVFDGGASAFPLMDLSMGSVFSARVNNDMASSFTPSLPTTELQTAIQNSGVLPRLGTDILAVYYTSQASVPLAAPMTDGAADVEMLNNDLGFAVGDFSFVGDCTNSVVFAVTGVSGNNLSHTSFGSSVFSPTDETRVRRAIFEVYYVGNTGRTDGQSNTLYSLYRLRNGVAEEMVPGVSLLRFRYGIRSASGEISYQDVTTALPAGTEVATVQGSFIVTSDGPVLAVDDQMTYQLFGTNYSPTDPLLVGYEKYFKKAYTVDVWVRNGI